MATMESRMGAMPHYTTLPASPTLTNPDMILPDYDRSNSPDLDGNTRPQSPLLLWKNPHTDSSNNNLQQLFSGVHAFPSASVTPTTPIIYGNGTMLSDIGEVTEAESTPGQPSPSSVRHRGASAVSAAITGPVPRSQSTSPTPLPPHLRGFPGTPRRSSPTVGGDDMVEKTPGIISGAGGGVKRRARQQQQQTAHDTRRDSIDSNSTITTQEQAGLFADFDDAVSVGDSVFQGDDEESVAEFYTEEPFRGIGITSPSLLTVPSLSGGPGSGNTSDEDERRHSTASLSRRAEEILANAKRRLTTMEDNLSRARSSLYVSSPTTGSVPSDGSTPPRTPLRSATAFADARPHQTTFTSGHTRQGSDGATPPEATNGFNTLPQRSASALGAAGGYRPPRAAGSQSMDQVRNSLDGHVRLVYSKPAEPALEPLGEDEAYEEVDEVDERQYAARDSAQLETFLSPTFGSFNGQMNGSVNGGLSRSSSVTQVRDLKDQMKDLKGKISSLREQARADSMKRRSLQSLRTPSPFTYARVDQWYAEAQPNQEQIVEEETEEEAEEADWYDGPIEAEDYDDIDRDMTTPTAHAYAEASANGHSSGESSKHDSVIEVEESPVLEDAEQDDGFVVAYDADDADDLQTEDGYDEEAMVTADEIDDDDAHGGYESEGGESLYHDSVQHQISHEDREDAFDYEHFILHSALGTMSQQRLGRGRSDSFSSEDSVETTRGPTTSGGDYLSSLDRRSSMSSLSTIDSFATATEGRSSRATRQVISPDQDSATDELENSYGNGDGWTGAVDPKREAVATPAAPASTVRRNNSVKEVRQTPTPSMVQRPASSAAMAMRRPASSAAVAGHRPSVSSFESTGTTRSFPLVNRSRLFDSRSSNGSSPPQTGNRTATPPSRASSDNDELKSISETILDETASICEQAERRGSPFKRSTSVQSQIDSTHSVLRDRASSDGGSMRKRQSEALKTMSREDQFLVERLVGSLGQCVLGLSENGRASVESRICRRRIEAARRILEGLDPV